jgi:hypothetical protein
MKTKLKAKYEKCRITKGDFASNIRYGLNGVFLISYKGITLNVIASDGGGWDHVSVSVEKKNRTPTWKEMCFIKDVFFKEDEVAFQYHSPCGTIGHCFFISWINVPAKIEYINFNPYVLHLWRPHNRQIPMPPKIFV